MVRLGVKRSLIYNGFFDLVAIPPRATKNIPQETPIHADRRFCFRNTKSSCPVYFRPTFPQPASDQIVQLSVHPLRRVRDLGIQTGFFPLSFIWTEQAGVTADHLSSSMNLMMLP